MATPCPSKQPNPDGALCSRLSCGLDNGSATRGCPEQPGVSPTAVVTGLRRLVRTPNEGVSENVPVCLLLSLLFLLSLHIDFRNCFVQPDKGSMGDPSLTPQGSI